MRLLPARVRSVSIATLLCVAAMSVAHAQQAVVEPKPTPPIPADATLQQLITPEQFKSAGLKKLSPAELKNLNNYLRGMRAQAEKAAVEKVIPPPSPRQTSSQSLIESSIIGNFDGLRGRSRWLLKNGQVWQQANSDEHFSAYAENSPVVLARTDFGYKMNVSGVAKSFYVRQIVLP